MPSRSRIAAAATVLLVAAITGSAAVVAGGTGAAIKGTAVREAPVQSGIAQRLEALVQASAQTNTMYVAVTPCRVVNTTKAGGRMAKGATRTVYVSGSTGFPAQGGKPGGCGVPTGATAVTASVMGGQPAGSGTITAYPAGATLPTAITLHLNGGVTSNTGVTLGIRPGTAKQLTIHTSAATHVVIDVTGYYLPQLHGMVAPASSSDPTHNAPIFAGSSRIVSATNPSAGVYVVTFDSNITYCTPVVDTYNAGSGIYGAAYAFSGNTATVFTWYLSSTTHQETLFSYYFYITIIC